MGNPSLVVQVGKGMTMEGKMVFAERATRNMTRIQDHGLHELALGVNNVAKMGNSRANRGVTTADTEVQDEFFGGFDDRVQLASPTMAASSLPHSSDSTKANIMVNLGFITLGVATETSARFLGAPVITDGEITAEQILGACLPVSAGSIDVIRGSREHIIDSSYSASTSHAGASRSRYFGTHHQIGFLRITSGDFAGRDQERRIIMTRGKSVMLAP